MASITIRIVDEQLKRRLWLRTAEHGRSIEDEARDILRSALSVSSQPRDLGGAIQPHMQAMAGADLAVPPRQAMDGSAE